MSLPANVSADPRTRTAQAEVEQQLPHRYLLGSCLGEGSYGQVFEALDRVTGEKVAIKRIRPTAFETLLSIHRVWREVSLLHLLRHENIVKMKNVLPLPSSDFSSVFIVTERMDYDLAMLMSMSNQGSSSGFILNEAFAMCFMYQILCGLRYMHKGGILHRDLKPQNILVGPNCEVRICDLGLARHLEEDISMTGQIAGRFYRAPELLMDTAEHLAYTGAVDVWAAGCILGELLSIPHRPLFPGRTPLHQLELIARVVELPKDVNPAAPGNTELRTLASRQASGIPVGVGLQKVLRPCRDCSGEVEPVSESGLHLLLKMLRFSPTTRITAKHALQHPFFGHLFSKRHIQVRPAFEFVDINPEGNEITEIKELIRTTVNNIHSELLGSTL
eukprot:RCo013386